MLHASAPRSDNGKENSRKWMKEKKKLLEWWAERLVDGQGRALDLRRVRLARHVLPILDGLPGEELGTWRVEPSAGKPTSGKPSRRSTPGSGRRAESPPPTTP